MTTNPGGPNLPSAASVSGTSATADPRRATFFLVGVYVAMLLGMAAKTLFNHYTRNETLQSGSFIVPLLVSPLIYGTVFNIVRNSSEPVMMLIFGFQNGFFWQDVLGEVTRKIEAPPSPH